MNIPAQTKAAIDYQICRYGGSPAIFRGPPRSLEGEYVAVLGGSETFGKFVKRPFVDLLEKQLGLPVVNLGIMQAGPQLFLEDKRVRDIASAARATIIQVTGAQNMSNRFYSVHPRRNDRFLTCSGRLQALYPGTDFTEFNFTGHLMSALEERDKRAFARVVLELKLAWVRRMQRLISLISAPCVLLWMSEERADGHRASAFDTDPVFVDNEMLLALESDVASIVHVNASRRARREGLRSRCFLPGEEAAALALPGPHFHRETAQALSAELVNSGLVPFNRVRRE